MSRIAWVLLALALLLELAFSIWALEVMAPGTHSNSPPIPPLSSDR
jgi:hypothetical protein